MAAAGFTDLYIWAGVSVVFALMSWRGAKEKTREEITKREQYEADVAAAAARQRESAPWCSRPLAAVSKAVSGASNKPLDFHASSTAAVWTALRARSLLAHRDGRPPMLTGPTWPT